MTLKFSRKTNNCGWREQIEINTDTKTYQRGAFLFHSADVEEMTKKQLDSIEQLFLSEGYIKI